MIAIMQLTNSSSVQSIQAAQKRLRHHLSPAPLIRSYALEKLLDVGESRRVWIKDYGWTPVGSFKLMGALNWMASHLEGLGDRPVVAHSSGNFASGIAFAGMRYGKRVIIVMPESAPKVKFELTRSFGGEIRTYDLATDHQTGIRDQMVREITLQENAIQASPYDDNDVISGNGVGGLEIAEQLIHDGRTVSHFFCAISGGGLMAGHALAMAEYFPSAKIVGVEPEGADDFRQSLAANERIRMDKPQSICDGLLSYDVGVHNWPILQRLVRQSAVVSDSETRQAMKWLYDTHGLKSEPSGAITLAAAMSKNTDLSGDGDIVLILSGRNVDNNTFLDFIG